MAARRTTSSRQSAFDGQRWLQCLNHLEKRCDSSKTEPDRKVAARARRLSLRDGRGSRSSARRTYYPELRGLD